MVLFVECREGFYYIPTQQMNQFVLILYVFAAYFSAQFKLPIPNAL